MTTPHPLPKVSAADVFPCFPRPLIEHLRQVLEATSDREAFAAYCNVLEWLTTYLDNLANSVYLAGSIAQIDEALEASLRGLTPPISFGTARLGLQLFAGSRVDINASLPELAKVLQARIPFESCSSLVQAFVEIKRARSDFEVPPARLARFIEANRPGTPKKVKLPRFLEVLVPFRNKGIGHQAEKSWFPNDRQMFALIRSYLNPAVDDLLCWEPMRQLLSRYEVVDVEVPATTALEGGRRACATARPRVTDALAPLGPSRLLFPAGMLPVEHSAYVACRGETASELYAIARYVHFPKTLQSSELLARRYVDTYLDAYLVHGLITPTQRQGKLRAKMKELALPTSERERVEAETQEAINLYSSDDPSTREHSLERLAKLLDRERAAERRETLLSRLEELPKRRKDYVFEQVDNNVLMSFAQLRAETELSEPDLDTVLGDLEQEERVRQINGAQTDRLHGHFKAQDPSKPERLRTILADLRPRRPRRGYPAPLRRLVDLCAELLSDEGLSIDDADLKALRDLFAEERRSETPPAEDSDGAAMTVHIGDEELRADNLRELFAAVWHALEARELDPSPAVPLLIGKTRYLVARTPEHANGTPFAAPIEVDGVFFEGNLPREQALTETLRLLARLGVTASSPDVETPIDDDELEGDEPALETVGLIEVRGDGDEEESRAPIGLGVEIEAAGDLGPVRVEGPTVPRFLAALLDHLLTRGAPIAEAVPVATGRVRYLLAEEPYHKNGRRFDSMIERGGYSVNTAYTYDQALSAAALLCEKLGLKARPLGRTASPAEEAATPLSITVGDDTIEASDVPSFLEKVAKRLFGRGLLRPEDIPYKSGRVRYLIAETPTHDHGRAFIRPVEVDIDGHHYFIEANISRPGAIELVQRLIASKQARSDEGKASLSNRTLSAP